MEEEVKLTGEFKAFSGGRELVRLRPNGSHWTAPDITDKEIREAFPRFVEMAASLNWQVLEAGEKRKLMIDALKECDEEFDTLGQVADDPVEYGRYVGLRSMIEEALKQ